MATISSAEKVPFSLYDHEIQWQPFEGIENLELTLCDVDEDRRVVDLLVRFAPNQTVTMHNHLAQTNMFIIQGELRMYEPDGSIREARPAGRYYRGKTNDAHSEGGGPDGAVVLYSMRADDRDEVLQILDDDQQVVATITMGDVRDTWAAQQAAT